MRDLLLTLPNNVLVACSGQTKPQAKNTLEEALSSHLDIAIQKSQLRTNSTRASRGTANPESTEFTSKIPCEFINVLPLRQTI